MKERPILFSGPMVQAILEGRKTQTRRVVKPQPSWEEEVKHTRAHFPLSDPFFPIVFPIGSLGQQCGHPLIKFPYGQPGDRLWVRETFRAWCCDKNTTDMGRFLIRYAADHGIAKTSVFLDPDYEGLWNEPYRWFPSIHMPRWASRLTLEITGVRVERLQGISEEDAAAEGSYLGRCECLPNNKDRTPLQAVFRQTWCHIHGEEFKSLWQSINGKRSGCSWNDNPWVWVVEFKRVEGKS